MFEDMLNDFCDIYRIESEQTTYGYGINPTNRYHRAEEPAVSHCPCHFHRKSSSNLHVTQQEPYRTLDGDIKLTLPYGTDIRTNDIVIDLSNGYSYRAGVPRNVREHHVIVTLQRDSSVKGAL